MREVKAGHIVLPQKVKDELDWDNRYHPEELVQIFTLVETISEMKEHIKKHYDENVNKCAIEWHTTSQTIHCLQKAVKPISNTIAPYFNRYRLPPQHGYIKYSP